jgi:hypothetical protein
LINEDAQVSIEGGPLLAVRDSPNPIASAAGQYAVWGQTQRVTVTGEPGTVDHIAVLFVTNIQWAAQAPSAAAADNFSPGGVMRVDDAITPASDPAAAKTTSQKAPRKRS